MWGTQLDVTQLFISGACRERHGDPTAWAFAGLFSMGGTPVGLEMQEQWRDAHGQTFIVQYFCFGPSHVISATCKCCDGFTSIDAQGEVPADCVGCGTCCFSQHQGYVQVFPEDVERMGPEARLLVEGEDGKRAMRMVENHCAALVVDPDAMTFRCSIYEERPKVCREFEHHGDRCKGHLLYKRRLPIVSADTLRRRRA